MAGYWEQNELKQDAETVRQMRQDNDADLEERAKLDTHGEGRHPEGDLHIEPIRSIVVKLDDEDGVNFARIQVMQNSWEASPTRAQVLLELAHAIDDAFEWLARRAQPSP